MLARVVADEMRKVYHSELGPQPISLIAAREVIAEEVLYDKEGNSSCVEPKSQAKGADKHNLRQIRERTSQKILTAYQIFHIMQEIVEEEEESKKRNLRDIVGKQERLKSCPPHIGMHKCL